MCCREGIQKECSVQPWKCGPLPTRKPTRTLTGEKEKATYANRSLVLTYELANLRTCAFE